MIWSTLARGVYWTLGGVQAIGEVIAAGRRLWREAWRKPDPERLDDTDPIPLTHREVERVRQQIACAARPADSPTPPGCPPPRPRLVPRPPR